MARLAAAAPCTPRLDRYGAHHPIKPARGIRRCANRWLACPPGDVGRRGSSAVRRERKERQRLTPKRGLGRRPVHALAVDELGLLRRTPKSPNGHRPGPGAVQPRIPPLTLPPNGCNDALLPSIAS